MGKFKKRIKLINMFVCDTIELTNRYGKVSSTLKKIDDKRFIWSTTDESPYYRVGGRCDGDGEISFLDPDGGPFISSGTVIDCGNGETVVVKSVDRKDSKYIVTIE